jgi:hypothetical protein
MNTSKEAITPSSAHRLRHPLALLCLLCVHALSCAQAGDQSAVGGLALGLTTQAGGVTYRLEDAKLTLEGPEKRELSAAGQDELQLELMAGAYRLTLQPGYVLTRADDAAGTPVAAELVSQNPAPVLVSAGQTARATLRFALAEGGTVGLGAGTLHVGIAVGQGDAGAGSPECARGLRVNEIDYEQASSDESEFVELLNAGSCAASLVDLTLELVNGSDTKAYATYALSEAGPSLAPGERLVLGDPSVLALLTPEGKRMALKGSGLQNGPDAVRIVRAGQLLDSVAYGEPVAGSSEGSATPIDAGELSLSRCPDGFDTGDGALDFALATPTPGLENSCTGTQNKSATMPSSMSQRR